MTAELITLASFCSRCGVDPGFVGALEEAGLIELDVVEQIPYVQEDQLPELERYAHLYYDLHINVEGIDAIRHLLDKVNSLRDGLEQVKNRLRIYEPV